MIAGGKIPVWTTVIESYRFVVTHPSDCLRVGWLPLAIFFTLNLLLDTASTAPSVTKIAIFVLVQTLIAAVILVAWHRVVLLGTGPWQPACAVGLGWREFRYLLAWTLLSVLFVVFFALTILLVMGSAFAAMMIVQAGLILAGEANALELGETSQFVLIGYLAFLPAFLVASYFTTRLSLVLPALATDKGRSLGRAWSLSSGNGWRLVLAAVLVMLPVELLSVAISFAASRVLGTALYYPLALAAACCLLLLIIATGTVLSLFSIELDGRNQAPESSGGQELTPALGLAGR